MDASALDQEGDHSFYWFEECGTLGGLGERAGIARRKAVGRLQEIRAANSFYLGWYHTPRGGRRLGFRAPYMVFIGGSMALVPGDDIANSGHYERCAGERPQNNAGGCFARGSGR